MKHLGQGKITTGIVDGQITTIWEGDSETKAPPIIMFFLPSTARDVGQKLIELANQQEKEMMKALEKKDENINGNPQS